MCALDVQEGKHLTGEDDAADHCRKHGRKQCQVDEERKGAHQGIPPFCQMGPPAKIQQMVKDPQHEHAGSQPFMRTVPDQLTGHQQQQQHRHGDVAIQRTFFFIPMPTLQRRFQSAQPFADRSLGIAHIVARDRQPLI